MIFQYNTAMGSVKTDETSSSSITEAHSLFYKDRPEKAYKQLTGFLVDRKISEEEITNRYEWIKTKRLKSNDTVKDQNRVTRKVYFPDTLCGLYCARFSSDGETIATTYGSGCIQLRNGETGELRVTIRSSLETSLPVTCCRFHPIQKEILYAASACGSIFICKLDNIEFWKFVEELDNEINALDVNISGDFIASAGKDASLKVYDAETGKLLKNYQKDKADLITENAVRFHHMKIFSIKCHQTNKNVIVTGGWDDTLKIWDTRVGDGSIRSMHGPHICGDAIDLQDTNILTGSWTVKDSLQIWDFSSAKLIETVNPTNREASLSGEFLYSARYFDGDPYGDHVLVAGSGTGNVEVINLKEKSIVARFMANKAVVAIDSYKSSIVYGGMDPVISIADYN
ncbi:uncharacterized WD repeat-containing protein all2124-like [Nasonia vitripennis]|uniref:Anaphase-promoting complex subunit 4-like WD40 domain-containing protein n=1 Tax=Nasonia vitripennis TaxID=7425 RepID=A0A7M7H8Y0_NASVI|nr:uncharacterized WD repeat-containing protein all2124-like [Nasonia vitripennis]